MGRALPLGTLVRVVLTILVAFVLTAQMKTTYGSTSGLTVWDLGLRSSVKPPPPSSPLPRVCPLGRTANHSIALDCSDRQELNPIVS